MTQPTALSVKYDRAAVTEELRRLLPRMEGRQTTKTLPFGLAAIDRHLPDGGLAWGGLHEIMPKEGATAAAFGFVVAFLARFGSPPPCREGLGVGVGRFCTGSDALASPRDPPTDPPPQRGKEKTAQAYPIFLILPRYGPGQRGRLYGHGVRALGLDPAGLILVETANRRETLWAMEEALRSKAPAAVVGLIDRLDLKCSQRLHLAAADAGLPLLLLRPVQMLESSAAATRWRIDPAEAARDRFGLFVRPRWHLKLERCRNGRPGQWVVEYDHVAHRFSLAAALADPAFSHRPGENPLRKTYRA